MVKKRPSHGPSSAADRAGAFHSYLKDIVTISDKYLRQTFSPDRYETFLREIGPLDSLGDRDEIVRRFIRTYERFVKEDYQSQYPGRDQSLMSFLQDQRAGVKIIWGDCYHALEKMDSESIRLMVTSPPYYNAREYSQWRNLEEYLRDMKKVIAECYRVLDNHRVFVFNVGDVFDNDRLVTSAVWGRRRLPLGAYFARIFEECGFTFVDDYIWDKGEVQSERHKRESKPYPFYQYPMNCYEHILIFHKHRLDRTRYPCPICGCLKVNGNTQSEIGLQSWECKNPACFTRSASNRGKRFSLKTNLTQRGQWEESAVDPALVKKWRRDIVKFPPVIKIGANRENRLGHTAPFPRDIPAMAVSYYTYPGDTVLDPFAGSFTTAIVATGLGRMGIGIEVNKRLFRGAILKRIAAELGGLTGVSEYDLDDKNG